ncbi:JmjC domain-containing protein 4 [Hypsibius exemplaris]|uniref:Jumonji domain-containing protein 4 n=1 Tax=Hypsibius exemplaris TaxID=2072580 RepID=A0A1W0X717_HYPEX|nr:JmjC domain-containing protein 4 [Hypsibius exemplaris]
MTQFSIDRITTSIPYSEFYRRYLIENRPCILSDTFTASWSSRTEWVSADGTLDLDFLVSHYGPSEVPVTQCEDQTEYGAAKSTREKFRDFVEYLKMAAINRPGCRYLKDWHFQREFPNVGVYSVPEYFSSDWLNEFCDENGEDDYRFLYLGPAGSWTPLHEDVLQSFSWSANIAGRKRWILFPPGEEEKLRQNGRLISDVTSVDLSAVAHSVVIQEAGEVVFVPSRWHHQVHNLEDTLSINHNWINGTNVRNTWALLSGLLGRVEKEISDCRPGFKTETEWMTQCQRILRADVAMDFGDFRRMLVMVVANRKCSLMSTNIEQPHHLSWLLESDLKSAAELLDVIDDHLYFRVHGGEWKTDVK